MRISADPDYQAFCEERLQNPYPLFDRLRAEDPVHWCEPMKLWLVTRYEDVYAGLREPLLSTNRAGMYEQALSPELKSRVQPLLDHVSKWMLLTDDPVHKRLRKLVNLAFLPKMVDQLRPRVKSIVNELLDNVPINKPFDIMKEFASPLPATVICEILGIPLEERYKFKTATEGVMQFSTRGGPRLKEYAYEAHNALGELITMFERLIQECRHDPKDDLLSALVLAEADGDQLSNEELYAMCVFIFLAGHETTTNGIANGILALLQHPDQFESLKADLDGLASGAVEETLRYESPVSRAVRQAIEDVEIGGKMILAGQLVVLLLGAANRDGEQFPLPGRYLIGRKPIRHLAFGYGIHFCIGSLLARIEMEVSFCAIFSRFPNLDLAGDRLTWKHTMGVRGLNALTVIAR